MSTGLECRGVGVGVGGRTARLALVDARLRPACFTAIVGPNGAGKSTLLSHLAGERAPLCGEVVLDGRPLARHGAQALALRRAVMPQDCGVAFDFTAQEVVELGRYPHRGRPGAQEGQIVPRAMELTQVAHLAQRSVTTLSGGERARVHLARALAQVWQPPQDGGARWLLLDEPTAALDLAHQHLSMGLLRRLAREQGMGVVAVIHDLNLALRYADEVLLLGHGRCQTGPVQAVLTPEAIARVWGLECMAVAAADGVTQYLFGAEELTCQLP